MNSSFPDSAQEAIARVRELFDRLEQAPDDLRAVFWPSGLFRYLNATAPAYPLDWTLRFVRDYLPALQIANAARCDELFETLTSLAASAGMTIEELQAESERIWYLPIDQTGLSREELDDVVICRRLTARLCDWQASLSADESEDKLERRFSQIFRMISHLNAFSADSFWEFLENHLTHFITINRVTG